MFCTNCICFGCGAPRLFWGYILPQFVLVLATWWQVPLGVWPCRLKYDWALILRLICHPVASLYDFRCFAMACSSHLQGCFIPLRCAAFRHRSILLSWYVLLDPVFASFALVKVVPVNLCPLLLFAICDYLVITGGLISRCRALTFILS